VRFATYGVTLNYHGLVEGKNVIEFVQHYVGKMPDLGPVTGAAGGFYYGKKGPRDFLSVVIDNSLAVPNGLYVRINAIFDGKQLPPSELPKAGAAMVSEVLGAFQLEHALDVGQGK
jgi:hypothetical protein